MSKGQFGLGIVQGFRDGFLTSTAIATALVLIRIVFRDRRKNYREYATETPKG